MVIMAMFDWTRHWKTTCETEKARRFAMMMADRLSISIRNRKTDSVADYGCGPAALLFALADRFPETEFSGFDIAEVIIERNSEKASELGLKNLHFEQDGLPSPRKEKMFDLVTCFATLHYVKEIELAIKNLFQLVSPLGYLIFNYPNIYTQAAYRKDIKPQDEIMKNRFALVLAGKNLLSIRKVDFILGSRSEKFYSSTRANVYLLVRKISK